MIEKLQIGIFNYDVEERDEIFTSQGGRALGTVEQMPPLILIEAGMPKRQTEHAIIHESLHAYDYQYGLSLSEHQIQGLATAMYDFITKNRHFVDEV